MEKVTTLATIILGYFGLVAQTNPHANSKLNFYETLIYVKIFLLFFTIIVSFAENNDAQSKTFNWKTNPFFIIFVIIQIVETVIDIKLIITYFCVTLPSDNIKKGITIKLRIHEW